MLKVYRATTIGKHGTRLRDTEEDGVERCARCPLGLQLSLGGRAGPGPSSGKVLPSPVRLSVFCLSLPLRHFRVSVSGVRVVRSWASCGRYDPECIFCILHLRQGTCCGPRVYCVPGACGVPNHHSGWEPLAAWSMLGLGRLAAWPCTTPALLQTLVPELRVWLLVLAAAWGLPRVWPLGWGLGAGSALGLSGLHLGPVALSAPAPTVCTRGPTRAWEGAPF